MRGNLKAEVDYIFFDDIELCKQWVEEKKEELADPSCIVEHKWNFKKCFRHSKGRDAEGGEPKGREVLKKKAKKEVIIIEEVIIATPDPKPKKEPPPPKIPKTPAAGNNNNFSCLDDKEGLTDHQKRALKQQYPEELLKLAAKYVYHPSTVLTGDNAHIKLLRAVLKNPKDYEDHIKSLDSPVAKERSARKDLIAYFKDGEVYQGFECLKSEKALSFIHPLRTHTKTFEYTDPDFMKEITEYIKKAGILLPENG
jgi:hypothetical protein